MKNCNSIVNCKEEKKHIFNINGYFILECKICGHRFCKIDDIENHLSNVYSDDYFYGGKDGYPNYISEKGILYKHGFNYATILSKYSKPGRILDVGCAAGFILKSFEQQGWIGTGIEPNATMAAYGRSVLNLNIQIGSLESFETDQTFDLITFIQVIGHFYDLDKAIINASNHLHPGGFILVESWNRSSLVARIMGKKWHEFCPPIAIHWFSDHTLTDLFDYYGFHLIEKGLPKKRINLKHALSILDSKIPNIFMKRNLFNFLNHNFGNVNLIYPPLDLKWYLLQK
jgi:SAM-dependent methyltransferase